MKIVNRDNIIDALNEGIDAKTIQDTFVLLDNKYGNLTNIPKQYKTIIEGVCAFKQDVVIQKDSNYKSSFFQNNSNKLYSAINDGISNTEIVNYFSKNDINVWDNTIRLLSGLKGIEKRYNNTKESGYQKKLIKIDKPN